MKHYDILALTFLPKKPLIVGHLFENLTPGKTYPVKSWKAYLLTITDDAGRPVQVTKTARREFFTPCR